MKKLKEHGIVVPDGRLTAYSIGQGPDVLFLHGGPGDTHEYMARMAEPLFKDFCCIFFDQRGTGKSSGFSRTKNSFTVEALLSDLIAIKSQLGLRNPALVGHSWGAMYALFACIQNPESWDRAALISMGPLDSEMGEQTANHLVSVLTEDEKEIWQRLRSDRNKARDEQNIGLVEKLDKQMMSLRVKAWVFNSELRSKFLDEYFQDLPPDREINKLIWENVEGWFSWDSLSRIKRKLWVCSGRNDSVPVAQLERVAQKTPHTKISIFDRCGHIPWLEHKTSFYSEMREFLS